MCAKTIAAKGIAAFVYFLLLALPLSVSADETYDANLVEVKNLASGPYSHRVSVRIGNRTEHLLLNHHSHLNDVQIVDSDGHEQRSSAVAYSGIVEALPSSWARLVIDGDFIAGTISSNGNSLHLASDTKGFDPSQRTMGDITIEPPTAFETPLRSAMSIPQPDSEDVVVPYGRPFMDARGNVTRVASVGIVVDSLYDEAIGGRGLSKAIATINSVDGLYREKFGLAFKVEVVVLITDENDLVLNGSSLEENLGIFRDYRIENELLPADLALVHLFTGSADPNTNFASIGLAYSGAACRTDGYDVSLSLPFRYPVVLAAHEIGHNLGAAHDDQTDCSDITNNLMFSEITSTTTREFSNCSSTAINTRLEQSACYSAAMDIGVELTQLESNQILATVTNNDTERAFPSATLKIDLKNATVTEAPAICELLAPSELSCTVPATYAGDTQDIAVKLSLAPEEARTINLRLEAVGFFDLNDSNNDAELIIPAAAIGFAGAGNGVTSQGTVASSGSVSSTLPSSGGNSGGGTFSPQTLVWMLVVGGLYRRRLHNA